MFFNSETQRLRRSRAGSPPWSVFGNTATPPFAGRLTTLVRFAKTLRGWRASITQQEGDLRYVLKQVKPRQELGLLALAVQIKPPSQPLQNTVKSPSPQPVKFPSQPSKHGQKSKPPQSHPTFKTRSNPPHPPAPLLNRSNPPRVPNPRRTHPKPTRYSQSLQNMVKTPSKPTCTALSLGTSPSPKSSSSLGAWQLKIRACNSSNIFAVQSPSLSKSKRLCTTAENVEATLVNSPDLEA